jgi:hypothetical protein
VSEEFIRGLIIFIGTVGIFYFILILDYFFDFDKLYPDEYKYEHKGRKE